MKQAPATMRLVYRSLLKMLVRAVGIEPTLLAERDFESLLSQARNVLLY